MAWLEMDHVGRNSDDVMAAAPGASSGALVGKVAFPLLQWIKRDGVKRRFARHDVGSLEQERFDDGDDSSATASVIFFAIDDENVGDGECGRQRGIGLSLVRVVWLQKNVEEKATRLRKKREELSVATSRPRVTRRAPPASLFPALSLSAPRAVEIWLLES
uniref:DUF834 domain-containing protein n=1 Tax=Oryza rufipogon TaxID=4529 RepID=A0A0E0NXB6_ORYRU